MKVGEVVEILDVRQYQMMNRIPMDEICDVFDLGHRAVAGVAKPPEAGARNREALTLSSKQPAWEPGAPKDLSSVDITAFVESLIGIPSRKIGDALAQIRKVFGVHHRF